MTMRHMTKTLALALFAGAALLAGCDGGTDPAAGGASATTGGGKKLVVGFAQVGEESSWRTAETRSITEEAAKRGVELKFVDGQGKQENQIRALNNFVAQGVDAIILAPVVKTGWDQPLREAERAGIPVILVDRGVTADEALYATLIASDFTEEGRMAGRWLAEKTGGKASIVELEGSPGADPTIERKAGFAEVVARHPEMTIIRSQTGNFSMADGKQVMEALLKSERGNITAVYAHNDDMALGAIQAIEEAGLKPGVDILLVSIDGVRGAFEAMKAGKLNASVECNPLLGPAAFEAVEKAVAKQELPKRTVVKDEIYTKEQVTDELLAGRKY